MFSHKQLIQLSGLSSSTYYRRLKELKKKEIIKKETKKLISDKLALEIAKNIGFDISFKEFLNNKIEKIKHE